MLHNAILAISAIVALVVWRAWMQRRATAKLLSDENTIRCPYCGGMSFHEEADSDGVDVKCATPWCGHWFTDAGPFGLDDLRRADPTASEMEIRMRKASGTFRVSPR